MSAADKANWFVKWQGLTGKRRFDNVFYEERSIEGRDNISDEVDGHVTWRQFLLEGAQLGGTEQTIAKEWQEIIDTNQVNCLLRRNQWLVPIFRGVETRKRHRVSNESHVGRSSDITDEAELARYREAGRKH